MSNHLDMNLFRSFFQKEPKEQKLHLVGHSLIALKSQKREQSMAAASNVVGRKGEAAKEQGLHTEDRRKWFLSSPS